MSRSILLAISPVFFTMVVGPAGSYAADFVSVTSAVANLRASPSIDSAVVAKVPQSTTCELAAVRGDWFEVAAFTGDYRYLHSSVARSVGQAPPLTDEPTTLVSSCRGFVAAENRAMNEALVLEPIDFDRQIDLEWRLTDRYKMAVAQKYRLHPARSVELTLWCAKNQSRWR